MEFCVTAYEGRLHEFAADPLRVAAVVPGACRPPGTRTLAAQALASW